MAIAITSTEHDAAGLRRAASCSKDANAARRMLALALVMEGRSRAEAAQSCGMDRQTLRDWVHRFNQEGLAGLSDRKPPSPLAKPRLSPEHQAELAALVRSGPSGPERSVGALLRRLGFRHLSVRPHNPAQDPAAIAAHRKRMARPTRKRFLRSDLISLR